MSLEYVVCSICLLPAFSYDNVKQKTNYSFENYSGSQNRLQTKQPVVTLHTIFSRYMNGYLDSNIS